jgi:hypothetical protein
MSTKGFAGVKGLNDVCRESAAAGALASMAAGARASTAAGGATTELARLHERMIPSSLRYILAFNEKFERLADPLGFRKLGINSIVSSFRAARRVCKKSMNVPGFFSST